MEEIQAIYFLESGEVAYVLPRYQNRTFVTVSESETFGTVDIAFRFLELEKQKQLEGNESQHPSALDGTILHKFSTHTQKKSIILQLDKKDL